MKSHRADFETSGPFNDFSHFFPHANSGSWNKLKYPALCAAEAGPKGVLNPNYHTVNDLPEKLNFGYMLQFSRLALGLAIEVSEYVPTM
jgi:hypothetical protein